MSISYSLKLANSNIDEILIKKVLRDLSIESIGIGKLSLGFELFEFEPDIKMMVSFIKKPDYPEGHPANNLETMFLSKDFYHNDLLSYTLDKFVSDEEWLIQREFMYSSVMELAMISNREALFRINGDDRFFLKDGIFYLEESFHEYIESQPPFKTIFEKYHCKVFDGNHLY